MSHLSQPGSAKCLKRETLIQAEMPSTKFYGCDAPISGQGVVLERSPYSDFVFLEAMSKQGYIHPRCK